MSTAEQCQQDARSGQVTSSFSFSIGPEFWMPHHEPVAGDVVVLSVFGSMQDAEVTAPSGWTFAGGDHVCWKTWHPKDPTVVTFTSKRPQQWLARGWVLREAGCSNTGSATPSSELPGSAGELTGS